MIEIIEIILLQTPYYLLSLVFFLTAGLCIIAVRKRVVSILWLVLSISLVALSVYFFLIAATSSGNVHLSRGQIAPPIRGLSWVASTFWVVWLVLFVRGSVAVRRDRPDGPSGS